MSNQPFDMADLESRDTSTINLVHPSTGDELGATVEVYGQDSEVYRSETLKAEHKFAEYSRRNRGKFMPPEGRQELDRHRIIKCTVAIKGFVVRGQEITDPEEVYRRFPFAYEQVVAGIHDRANFIKGSSPT